MKSKKRSHNDTTSESSLSKRKKEANQMLKTLSVLACLTSPSETVRFSPKLQGILQSVQSLPLTRGRWSVRDGLIHLLNADRRFEVLIEKYDVPKIYLNDNDVQVESLDSVIPMVVKTEDTPFQLLIQTVIYQQVSGKSAAAIWKKFSACFEDREVIQPIDILSATYEVKIDEQTGVKKNYINGKISGLSSSKVQYVKNIAEAFNDANHEQSLNNVDFHQLTDEELFERLVAIKGLGPWSVNMFMIFGLHRSNVLPINDLGIRRGLVYFFSQPDRYYENKSTQKEIMTLCDSWQPYWSLASCYLWKLSEEKR